MTNRPLRVRAFEWLMYASVVSELTQTAMHGGQLPTQYQEYSMITLVLVIVGYSAFLIVLTWLTAHRRKNWARWVLSIDFVMSVAVDFPKVFAARHHQVAPYFGLLAWVLQGAALYFIYSGDSRTYFQITDNASGELSSVCPIKK